MATIATGAPQRRADDRGAAVVEFALALPFFMMLVLGIASVGLAFHNDVVVTGAARESARYGATVAFDQCDSACGGKTWASLVRQRAVDESVDRVDPVDVCVALVGGPGGAPIALDSEHTTEGALDPCFADGIDDGTIRVQVRLERQQRLEWMLGASDITLRATATARYEQ